MFELVMSKGFIVFFSSLMIYIISVFCMMIVYDELKIFLEGRDKKINISRSIVFVMSTPLAAIIYIAMNAFVNWGEKIS